MEALPRELVWEVVGCLPVRDVLLGVALVSRDFHRLLCGSCPSSPPSWTSNEFWRLYALRWRLVVPTHSDHHPVSSFGNDDVDAALEPPCWRSFCRAELEGWRFGLDESLHVDLPPGRLKVADVGDVEGVLASERALGVRKTVLLDKARRQAELVLHGDNWNATLMLVGRPLPDRRRASIRFHVTRQTGFWLVGVTSLIPQERLPTDNRPMYGETWDLRLAYNVNGSFHVQRDRHFQAAPESDAGFKEGQEVEVRVEHGMASFFVDNTPRGRPFSLDHVPKPWRFFWGSDGAASVATILPPRHYQTPQQL